MGSRVWRKYLMAFFTFSSLHAPWVMPLSLLAFVSAGCGYRPATTYARKVFTDRIYTDVEVYLRDPENAVLVKDALNEAIVSRFGARIADKKKATTILHVKFGNVAFTPIQYDVNGYAIYYRAKVTLTIRYATPDSTGTETVTGFYDFPIEPKAIISDALRFQAIKNGSAKALDAFISRIMLRGARP